MIILMAKKSFMAEFIGATRYCASDADTWGGQMTDETSVRIVVLGK